MTEMFNIVLVRRQNELRWEATKIGDEKPTIVTEEVDLTYRHATPESVVKKLKADHELIRVEVDRIKEVLEAVDKEFESDRAPWAHHFEGR